MSKKIVKEKEEVKRTSTRVRVISKAMRYVDEETRREFRDRRLQMLESDNFVEEVVDVHADDAYNDDDVSVFDVQITIISIINRF